MSNSVGVCCPKCGSARSTVVDSRENVLGRKRYRKCRACRQKYVSWEMTEATVHTYEMRDIYKALSKIEAAIAHLKTQVGDFKDD